MATMSETDSSFTIEDDIAVIEEILEEKERKEREERQERQERRRRLEMRAAQLRAERNDPLSLLRIVQTNNIELIKCAFVTDINKNGESDDGFTPLIQSIVFKDYQMCKHLLSIGVDVNYIAKKTRQTALSVLLHILQKEHNSLNVFGLRFVLLLLGAGADPTIQTTYKTAGQYLYEMGYEVSGVYLKRRYSLKQT
jgi:hypothetical protein